MIWTVLTHIVTRELETALNAHEAAHVSDYCHWASQGAAALTVLHNWCSLPNNSDGCFGFFPEPNALIQATDRNFYGTNEFGGAASAGMFFKLTPSGTLTTLYTFCLQSGCPDGYLPSGLMQAMDGNFYGTTDFGGGAAVCKPNE